MNYEETVTGDVHSSPVFFYIGIFSNPIKYIPIFASEDACIHRLRNCTPSVSFKKARKRDSFVLINQQLSQPTMSSVGNLDESLTSNYSLLPQKGIAGVPW